MSESRDSMLKAFASSLADALFEDEKGQSLVLMHRLGLIAEEEAAPAAPARPGWIGIWEPVMEDGAPRFERSRERAAEWSLWADVPRLEVKGSRRRVVLLGESVARGYFYDPQYTPARVLEELLAAGGVPEGVEVVDLAKNDLGAWDLQELLSAALALEPDVFVVFAGNNWAQAPWTFPEGMERYLAASILREGGAAALKAHLEAGLAAQVAGALGGLIPLSEQIPVVLIVPEFNLSDWRLDRLADVPWLPDGQNERWLSLLESSCAALAADRLDEAEARARELVGIDGGTAASGLMLLAECAKRRGHNPREFLERARDAHTWDTMPQVPKVLSVIQGTLRAAAGQGRIELVDLPRIFDEELQGEIPDRRLFLDYCHLNSQGIRTAMAAAAERLLPLLGAQGATREELLARANAPRPEVEAEAYFAAAIHNAHWGQPSEIVRYLCGKALATSPEIAPAMSSYLDLQTRQAPSWACASYAQLTAHESQSLRRYVTTYSPNKLLDTVLLDALAEALEEAGVPARERLDALRRAERGLDAGRTVDLLDPYYRLSWADRSGFWLSSFFYQAFDPVSLFPLVCRAADRPASFEITWRLPAEAKNGGEGTVAVNGRPVATLTPGAGWKTQRFTAESGLLREGVNRIEIRWPLALGSGSAKLRQAADHLERGLPYPLLPVFAEIHSFRVS